MYKCHEIKADYVEVKPPNFVNLYTKSRKVVRFKLCSVNGGKGLLVPVDYEAEWAAKPGWTW